MWTSHEEMKREMLRAEGLAYEDAHGPAKPIMQASAKHSGSFESCAAHSSTNVELYDGSAANIWSISVDSLKRLNLVFQKYHKKQKSVCT